MIKKFLVAIIAFISINTFAAEPINNIFGLKLGDVFNVDDFDKFDEEKRTGYLKINFKGFTEAKVKFTPKSKKIYEIKTEKESESCYSEVSMIAGILSKKYGNWSEVNDGVDLSISYYLKKDNSNLFLICRNYFKYGKYITIILNDKKLKEISIEEEIEIEYEKEKGNF